MQLKEIQLIKNINFLKMKLRKLTNDHYIITSNDNISEGDWFWTPIKRSIEQCVKKLLIIKGSQNDIEQFKITHSTQPLESKFSSIIYRGYYHISLSEVEEVINGYSVEKLSESANGYSVYGKPLGEKYLAFNEGYQSGFNAHKELVKDKLFTEQDLRVAISLAWNYGQKPENNLKDCGNSIVQSLLPKTEWEITFDEQGKLKLL